MNAIDEIASAIAAELRKAVHRQKPRRVCVPVGVSNRHVHLSLPDLEALFGSGYQLKVRNPLRQPGQYAAEETLLVAGPRGSFDRVRILGPVRKTTQVEVSASDCYRLGVEPVVRESGDLEGTPGAVLVGPRGSVPLNQGVVVAKRHVHMHSSEAAALGLKDGQGVSVAVPGRDRRLLFLDVVLRARDDFALEYHVDTDEANAAGLKNGDEVRLILSGVRDDWMT